METRVSYIIGKPVTLLQPYLTGKPGGQNGKSRTVEKLPGGAQRGESRGLGRIQLCNSRGSTQFLGPEFSFQATKPRAEDPSGLLGTLAH